MNSFVNPARIYPRCNLSRCAQLGYHTILFLSSDVNLKPHDIVNSVILLTLVGLMTLVESSKFFTVVFSKVKNRKMPPKAGENFAIVFSKANFPGEKKVTLVEK